MPNENYPLPKLLRYFREKKQMTQAEVAEQLSISRSGYANYESGRILPGIEHIAKLSKILDHDFLFAYSMSLKNAEQDNYNLITLHGKTIGDLKAVPVRKETITDLINQLKEVPTWELELLKTYVQLYCNEKNEKEKKNI